MTGQNVVPAQARKILSNDHIDFLGLNIGNHPLKTGAFKIRTAPAVIDVNVKNGKPLLRRKGLKQGFLIGYTFRGPFMFIFSGKANIKRRSILPWVLNLHMLTLKSVIIVLLPYGKMFRGFGIYKAAESGLKFGGYFRLFLHIHIA